MNSSRRTQIHLRWDFSDHPISLEHLWNWQRQLLAARCRAVAADLAELAQAKASTQLRLALYWLSKTGRDPSSGDVLLAALQAKDEAARYLAADALGRAGSDDDRFIDGLLEALRVTQAASRREEGVILHALARLRSDDPRIVAEVIAVFERDPTPHENEDLSEIMGDLGEAVLPDALRLLDQVAAKLDWLAAGGTWDNESDVAIARQYTLEAAIRRIGKPAVPSLVKRLDSTSLSLRSLARGILTNMQSEARDALPRLRRLLDETQDPMEKELIAWTIEVIEHEQEQDVE